MLTAKTRRRRTRGFSLVELMIGVTIGLFVLAAATMVATTQLAGTRRLTLETQVNQDLRSTLDIVSRELRQVAYWSGVGQNVRPSGTGIAPNPYRATVAGSDGGSYEFVRAEDEYFAGAKFGQDNGTTDARDQSGFRLNGETGVVEMRIAAGGAAQAGWQALTDAAVMNVTAFSIDVDTQYQAVPCGAACVACVAQRVAVVSIGAQARHDASVQRSAATNVRLRNDLVSAGACP